MLIYHPAYDVNHGMFRMLRLLEEHPNKAMPWDTFRIIDLYYLFPQLLDGTKLPPALTGQKRRLIPPPSKYTRIPTPRMFIQQLRGIHEAIARSLAAKGFLEPDQFDVGTLARTDRPLPDALQRSFADESDDARQLAKLLGAGMALIPLTGPTGLKQRTGLLEHRYDPS